MSNPVTFTLIPSTVYRVHTVHTPGQPSESVSVCIVKLPVLEDNRRYKLTALSVKMIDHATTTTCQRPRYCSRLFLTAVVQLITAALVRKFNLPPLAELTDS
jgi:hypothetical protein